MSDYLAQINQALAAIDAWIYTLEDWELSGKCFDSSKEFVAFMVQRGISQRYINDLVKEKMGVPANRLHTLADYQQLREAIAQNESTVATTLIDEKHGRKGTARRNLDHFWG